VSKVSERKRGDVFTNIGYSGIERRGGRKAKLFVVRIGFGSGETIEFIGFEGRNPEVFCVFYDFVF
jgi:hypothetical protein